MRGLHYPEILAILPNHPIACANMGLEIGSGKWVLYKAGAILSDGADSILPHIILSEWQRSSDASDHTISASDENLDWQHDMQGPLAKLEATEILIGGDRK